MPLGTTGRFEQDCSAAIRHHSSSPDILSQSLHRYILGPLPNFDEITALSTKLIGKINREN